MNRVPDICTYPAGHYVLMVDQDLFGDVKTESSGVMRIDVDMFHITRDVVRFIGVLYYEPL